MILDWFAGRGWTPFDFQREVGGQELRLPCFWFQPHGAVLPAFGSFTGMASIAPRPGDRVFVVADSAVLPASRQ